MHLGHTLAASAGICERMLTCKIDPLPCVHGCRRRTRRTGAAMPRAAGTVRVGNVFIGDAQFLRCSVFEMPELRRACNLTVICPFLLSIHPPALSLSLARACVCVCVCVCLCLCLCVCVCFSLSRSLSHTRTSTRTASRSRPPAIISLRN
jgi:hypothetical protein